jgi:Ca2+-binding EF-hand superfamily protein
LKCFLKQNNKNNSDIIDKNTFNILLKKQGILLEDTDIESICDAYDTNKTDYFNFIQFFNALRNVSNTRGAQIESFKEQVKSPGQNYIVFSDLLKMADMNYHPEAIKFIKSVPDLIREYENNWRKPKDEDRITEDDFRQFFYDVSTCVPNDVDFTQTLKALGCE